MILVGIVLGRMPMSTIESQVRRAQRRLWLNRWLRCAGWSAAGAAGLYLLLVVVDRLFDLHMPLGVVGLAEVAAAGVVSCVWLARTRDGSVMAAVALDEAAGLKERVSSGLYCFDSDDPFARAALADAEAVSSRVTVRRHLLVVWPRSMAYGAGAVAAALLALWLMPEGLLGKSEARIEPEGDRLAVQRAEAAIKKQLQPLKKLAETNPAFGDDLEKLDQFPEGKFEKPDDFRLEAVRRIDKLADTLRKRRGGDKFEQVKEFKKLLRGLKSPDQKDDPASRLSQALARGDLKGAREALGKIQEQLAKVQDPDEKAKSQELKKRLEEVAKQLDKLADTKRLEDKLVKAGIKPEDAKRMLQNLTKKDLEKIAEQLKKRGLNKEQIKKLSKELKRQVNAGTAAKKLANACRQAGLGDQQMGEGLGGLEMAGEQLSEMEQLEQEMLQLESAMSELRCMQANMGRSCSGCSGTGKGPGMSTKPGQGKGGLAPESETGVGFRKQRTKVHTGKGAIIGQFLVDGEQIRGDVSSEFSEAAAAAAREASDAIARKQIPRQYHDAVKDYFKRFEEVAGSPSGESSNEGKPAE